MALALSTGVAASGLPMWAVDPGQPGPDLPPAGRSLFDFIAADGVPFPFEALVRKVEQRAGCARPEACTRAVLIPLGRSLQRTAGAPDFFAHPRAVVAVTGEGGGPIYAKDRLYLGYQERSGIVEVVSYNEQAGRFEFQIVRDYRAGAKPTVVYAARAVCTACHQNQAPLFSRPVWDETNANPAVAEKLGRERIHGIDVRRGVDIPNAIDDATDRANLVAVIQRMWRDACDADCRAGAVAAAWRYRRSGERELDAGGWSDALAAGFRRAWPEGLAIPNPDIPNRDPFLHAGGREGVAQSHVAAAFEPLAPRPPLEVWRADDPGLARRFVSGLAAMLSERDVKAAPRPNAAIRPAALSGEVFTRQLAREAIGVAPDACCTDAAKLPPARGDVAKLGAAPDDAVPFVAACAACHATPERSPPNFLWGDAARIQASLRQCAPRIHARLSMWQQGAQSRDKVPMPPPLASREGRPWMQETAPAAVRTLRETTAHWLREETGRAPDLAELLADGYERLRPCLASVQRELH
jgi:cytochrome c553